MQLSVSLVALLAGLVAAQPMTSGLKSRGTFALEMRDGIEDCTTWCCICGDSTVAWKLYKEYRDTADIKEKGLFLSPSCHQICRPIPSFAARNKDTILQKMHEAAASSGLTLASSAAEGRGKKGCTIRPLRQDEFEFGTDDQVAPAGFASAEELSKKAQKERWVGMRVDMWNDEGVDLKGLRQGMLVKVRYWWREEDGQWTQTLHDLLYIGQLDGTEGSEGDRID